MAIPPVWRRVRGRQGGREHTAIEARAEGPWVHGAFLGGPGINGLTAWVGFGSPPTVSLGLRGSV